MNVFETLFQEGKGIFRLKPTWVPRSFCRPGQRLKLDPRDLYVYGTERGAIDGSLPQRLQITALVLQLMRG